MNEELSQLDAELKGLFVENKIDEMSELMQEKSASSVKEISDYNWNIIKKYYDTERFDLLFGHFKFVAYSCYIVEYAHKRSLISDEAFDIMMMIYNDILEMKRQQRS
jgi:predicted P-loop ATPase